MLPVPSGGTGIDAAASSSIGRRRQRLFMVGCSSSGNKHTAQYIRTSAVYSDALRPNDYSDINVSIKLIQPRFGAVCGETAIFAVLEAR